MAMIASAQAANLSAPAVTEPAYVPPPYTWSGFYIGVNGGYGWNSGGVSVIHTEPYYPSISSDSGSCCWLEANGINHNFDGGFGGGQIGFNVQRDRMVFGLEADFEGSGLSSSARFEQKNWFGYATASSQLDWFATIRGRLGLVAYDNWLVYITGGAAFGGVQDSLNQNFDWGLYTKGPSQHEVLGRSHSDAFVGYVLGAGLEYGISPAWSVKFEYQYMDLGFTRLTLDGHNIRDYSRSPDSEFDSGHSFSTARVGINYHIVPQYAPLK